MNWYALRVGPAWEKRVVAELEQRRTDDNGLDAYLPKETIKRRLHRGRYREWQRPLIPGYVFACLTDDQLAMAHEISGVHGVVMFGERPAVVPFAFLIEVRQAEMNGAFDITDDRPNLPQKPVKPKAKRRGGKVRIKHAEPAVKRLAAYVSGQLLVAA